MNIDIFDSITDLDIGSSLQQSIKNAIKGCDFVVLIYSSPSTNIIFEAGLAYGMNKPIFSVINPQADTPDILMDSPYVHALPDELEKIEFNLNLFYKNIKPKKTSSSIRTPKYFGGGEPVQFDNFINKFDSIPTSDSQLENFFKNLFETYNIETFQNFKTPNSKYTADFSIWSDPLNNIIGNPILIEIIGTLTIESLQKLSNTIEASLKGSPTASGFIVFYNHLVSINKNELPNSKDCLYIQISDLLNKLRSFGFNDAIRSIRNEIAHNKL